MHEKDCITLYSPVLLPPIATTFQVCSATGLTAAESATSNEKVISSYNRVKFDNF